MKNVEKETGAFVPEVYGGQRKAGTPKTNRKKN